MIFQLPILNVVVIVKAKKSYDDYIYKEFQKTESVIYLNSVNGELMSSLIDLIGALEQINCDEYLFYNKENAKARNISANNDKIFLMPSTSFYFRSSLSRAKRIVKKYLPDGKKH